MAKLKLTCDSQMEEVRLQMEFGPPPTFTSIDEAEDWALTNLPVGVYIEVHDGRKTLRAAGCAGKLERF